MAKFTFLEIHFDDSEFTATATAPFGPGEKDVEAGGAAPEPEDGSKSGAALAAVVGLVFLIGVAYLAKRRFVTDDGLEDALDDELEDEFEDEP